MKKKALVFILTGAKSIGSFQVMVAQSKRFPEAIDHSPRRQMINGAKTGLCLWERKKVFFKSMG